MSSARTLASAICPTAPFLVPARATVALWSLEKVTLRHTRCFAKQIKSSPRSSKFLNRVRADQRAPKIPNSKAVGHGSNPEAGHGFRQLAATGNVEEAMEMYPVARSDLTSDDTRTIARLVHNKYRTSPYKGTLQSKLLKFANVLVQDLKSGALPPHCAASLHLISLFKDAKQYSQGHEFWSWLVQQDEGHVNASVYGAAIEMLAYYGGKLEDLEALYVQALKHFPGTFAEYHLSPEAIVPDRGQQATIKGLPMTLLQGITTARIFHRDWKNAYLALDTALRLYPTQTPIRFFELFIYERSLAESYQVFMLACRSGVVLNAENLTAILSRLQEVQRRNVAGLFLNHNSTVAQAMLNAIHAYAGAGGAVNRRHINVAIGGLLDLIPYRFSVNREDTKKCGRLVLAAARHAIVKFARVGVAPEISTFNTLLSMGVKAEQFEMFESILKDLSSLGLEPDDITRRISILAAGRTKDPQRIEQTWKTLVDAIHSKGQDLEFKDWQTLANALASIDNAQSILRRLPEQNIAIPVYFEGLLEQGRHKLPNAVAIEKENPDMDSSVVQLELQHFMSRLTAITELIKSGRLQDFYQTPLPMSSELWQPLGPQGSEEDLRQLYDELTTDPRQPPSPDAPKAVSTTGFPLDELRFENWKSINELLAEAEWYERVRSEAVNKAIKTGKPVPRDFVRTTETSAASSEERKGSKKTLPIDKLRKRILTLRGLQPSTLHHAGVPIRKFATGS